MSIHPKLECLAFVNQCSNFRSLSDAISFSCYILVGFRIKLFLCLPLFLSFHYYSWQSYCLSVILSLSTRIRLIALVMSFVLYHFYKYIESVKVNNSISFLKYYMNTYFTDKSTFDIYHKFFAALHPTISSTINQVYATLKTNLLVKIANHRWLRH